MRLIYEKDGKFFKSESGIPEKDGVEVGLTREQVEGYALVYEADGKIRASETDIPAEGDTVLYPAAEVEEEEKDEPAAKEEDTPVEDTEDGPTYDLPVFGE